jgi:hypothetical protein
MLYELWRFTAYYIIANASGEPAAFIFRVESEADSEEMIRIGDKGGTKLGLERFNTIDYILYSFRTLLQLIQHRYRICRYL